MPVWREELARSGVVIVALDHDFYGSTGEDALAEAIRRKIPVLMLTYGRHVRVPLAFAGYEGTKHLILDQDWMAEAERVLRAWGVGDGVQYYDYPWERR